MISFNDHFYLNGFPINEHYYFVRLNVEVLFKVCPTPTALKKNSHSKVLRIGQRNFFKRSRPALHGNSATIGCLGDLKRAPQIKATRRSDRRKSRRAAARVFHAHARAPKCAFSRSLRRRRRDKQGALRRPMGVARCLAVCRARDETDRARRLSNPLRTALSIATATLNPRSPLFLPRN